MRITCVDFCRALADQTRQAILVMLMEKGELCVSDIVGAFDSSQPTISHHLSVLKGIGLVANRKEGKQVFYRVIGENVEQCCGMIVTKFGRVDDESASA